LGFLPLLDLEISVYFLKAFVSDNSASYCGSSSPDFEQFF